MRYEYYKHPSRASNLKIANSVNVRRIQTPLFPQVLYKKITTNVIVVNVNVIVSTTITINQEMTEENWEEDLVVSTENI